jgi:integrase
MIKLVRAEIAPCWKMTGRVSIYEISATASSLRERNNLVTTTPCACCCCRFIRRSNVMEQNRPVGSEDVKRSRILTDSELVKIWHACSGPFGDMVRLLILWGTRNGETGRLSRSWREANVITIPGKHTKNKRAHAIPLLPMALEILDRQPKAGGFFFPGKEPDSHFNDGSWGNVNWDSRKPVGCTIGNSGIFAELSVQTCRS